MNSPDDYAIVIVPVPEEDGGGYMGYSVDLPGCMSDGVTHEEAVQNTREALREWLEEQKDRGVEIPLPGSAVEVSFAREEKLLDAIKSLAEYGQSADKRIGELERKLTELIAVLKDERGRLPSKFEFPRSIGQRRTH